MPRDEERSSSAALSSPPHSPPASPSAQLTSSITVTHDAPVAPARRKPGRKPKNPPDTDTADPKPKRTRKPRDPNAPPIQRRRRTKDAVEAAAQPTEVQRIAIHPAENSYAMQAPTDNNTSPPSFPKLLASENEAIRNSVTGQAPLSFFNNNGPPPPPPPGAPQQQQQQQPPPPQPIRTSGQNYDPIRSNYDPVRENMMAHGPFNPPHGSPGHPSTTNRASASPSISSLVTPNQLLQASPSMAGPSFFVQPQSRLHRDEQVNSVPPSPTTNRLAPSAMTDPATNPAPQAPSGVQKKAETLAPHPGPALAKKPMVPSTATSSAAASPKPPKIKEAKDTYPTPPPLPGSGLVQLGGANDGSEFRAPTIIIDIPMNGDANRYVNFTRLAEEKYGWDALHPRLAAQRDRLARVAAAGAALERSGSGKESGDEMSLDSEGDGSNVEMGGMSDGRTGTDGGAKKIVRKRRMKEDEYDKDDGFVDDSELLWEEQAAAAIDGFFVYSGPLVPEIEKPTSATRGDGAPKRGHGRGSRGGTSRSTGGRGGSAQNGSRAGLPLTGPGSRGGSTTRKPRITKADRARMEQEKADRERMGSLASMPSNYGGMPQLASAANMGGTPMVFNQ